MIFDSDVDSKLNTNGIKIISFNIKKCHDFYLQKFLEQGYKDLTSEFIKRDFLNLHTLIDGQKSVIQLNKLYDYFTKLKESEPIITTRYHVFFSKMLPKIKNFSLVGMSYNRTILEAQKNKQSITNELLLADFAKYYIKPQYYEFKMYSQSEKDFAEYHRLLEERGVFPTSYNKVFIQNMQTQQVNTFEYK